MKWFTNPQTLEELKKQYKTLVFTHHPDKGGRTEDMQAINAEYEALFARLKNVRKSADGTIYTTKEENTETAEIFREILEKLIHLDGLYIEVCGTWVWVTGNTYDNRDTLKELHFKYSKQKNAWYWHEEGYHKFGKRSLTLAEIRALYGSERVTDNHQMTIAEANA
jgi:curved DNA-binding protein CbpA